MAHSSKKYMRDYMQGYRKTRCEKDKQKEEWINEAYDVLKESSVDLMQRCIQDSITRGHSLEDAEYFLKNSVSAGMWQEYLDSKGVEWAKGDTQPITRATDSEPTPKIDTSELVERSKNLLEQWVEMRAQHRQTDSEPRKPLSWQDALDRKREKEKHETALVKLVTDIQEQNKQHPFNEDAEKIRVLKEFHDYREKHPEDYPEPKKKRDSGSVGDLSDPRVRERKLKEDASHD